MVVANSRERTSIVLLSGELKFLLQSLRQDVL